MMPDIYHQIFFPAAKFFSDLQFDTANTKRKYKTSWGLAGSSSATAGA